MTQVWRTCLTRLSVHAVSCNCQPEHLCSFGGGPLGVLKYVARAQRRHTAMSVILGSLILSVPPSPQERAHCSSLSAKHRGLCPQAKQRQNYRLRTC